MRPKRPFTDPNRNPNTTSQKAPQEMSDKLKKQTYPHDIRGMQQKLLAKISEMRSKEVKLKLKT